MKNISRKFVHKHRKYLCFMCMTSCIRNEIYNIVNSYVMSLHYYGALANSPDTMPK